MDPYLHTIIAVITIAVAYYTGSFFGKARGQIIGIASCIFVLSKSQTDEQIEKFLDALDELEN